MVRFGNVLGSSGSVIETFESQIRDKKPLTVTSKDAKRFFMTIEEAITLSLEAASIGNSSDIYVLDMGQPVKLVDLAKDLLFLSEAVSLPGNNIVFTGLRAGDKIEEKLYAQEETVVKTKYDKLLMVVKKGQPLGQGKFQEWLKQVRATIDNNGPGIKHELEQLLKEILPDYLPYHEYINKINQKDLP